MLLRLDQLVDAAPEDGSEPEDDTLQDPKRSREKSAGSTAKDVPKNDQDKERVRLESETAAARAALSSYGSRRFMAALWKLIVGDTS